MGNTWQSCKSCNTIQPNSHNEPNEISSYYTARLTNVKQMQLNLPNYENFEHSRLVGYLRKRQEKFFDMVQPSQYLYNQSSCQWKRISQIYPQEAFSRGPGNFLFQYKNSNKNKFPTENLAKDLLKLSKFPQLIQKLFANTEISPEGFYVLYFCLGGNIQRKIQLVIDDFIPVSHNKYIFQQPEKGCGVWMILAQKAWAKLLKSYQALQKIQPSFFFSQMTGVPLPDLYHRGDFLMSSKYDFNPNQSKYLKVMRETPIEMTICIWFSSTDNFLLDLEPDQFVIQPMVQQSGKQPRQYVLLPVHQHKINNKLILLSNSQNMFMLPKGQNIFHIYNKSRSKRSCNIVIHSRSPVSSHTRYEKQFQNAKFLMIKNQYKKKHKSIETQLEYPGIELKFCWLGHRGIFYFKNKTAENKIIEMSIKKSFLHEIYFQDSNSLTGSIQINNNDYGFFIVVRAENRQYGSFYEISVNKSK